jgi:hypothetical protein
MRSMKMDFQAITRGLKAAARKMEQIAKKVDKLEKAKVAKKRTTKAKAKTTKRVYLKKKATKKAPAKRKAVVRKAKTTRPAATARILTIVKRFKKGVGVPELAKKTRFGDKKVRDILSRSFAQGKVKRVGRGLYAAA